MKTLYSLGALANNERSKSMTRFVTVYYIYGQILLHLWLVSLLHLWSKVITFMFSIILCFLFYIYGDTHGV